MNHISAVDDHDAQNRLLLYSGKWLYHSFRIGIFVSHVHAKLKNTFLVLLPGDLCQVKHRWTKRQTRHRQKQIQA